jgi:hypothetical protein
MGVPPPGGQWYGYAKKYSILFIPAHDKRLVLS